MTPHERHPDGTRLSLTAAADAIAAGHADGAGARRSAARARRRDRRRHRRVGASRSRRTCAPKPIAATPRRAPTAGPLHGIGIGVKDIIATADQPTQMGSPIYAGHRPETDAECVARLKRAGGYVFGKAVTTAFAFLDPAKTRNPWNPRHTPGGSSSGPAAAVAAGHVAGAIGTQTNGSVIRPAAYLRRRRVQADEGRDSVHRRAPLQRDARPARHVHPLGRRCRAARERARRRRAHRAGARRDARSRRDSPTSTAFRGRRRSIATPTTRSTRRRRRCASTAPRSSRSACRRRGARRTSCIARSCCSRRRTHLAALQDRERARLSPEAQRRARRGPRDRARRLRGRAGAARGRDRVLHRLARGFRRDHRAAGARPGARGPRLHRRSVVLHAVVADGLSGADAPDRPRRQRPAARHAARRAAGADDRLLAVAAWCEARLPFRGLALRWRACLRLGALNEAREEAPSARAAEGAQSGRALAAARQGRRARQDDGGEAARGQRRAREGRRAIRRRSNGDMTRWPHHPDTLSRRDLEENRMRELYAAAVDPTLALFRRAALRVADRDARGEAEGRGLVGVRVRVAAVESAVPGRRNAAGDARRLASALLPVVARLARHARVPGPRAGARSRRRVPRRRDAAAGDARDRRAAPAVAARDGRRLVSSALGEGRRRRARDRRADVRRPARPSAVRGTAVARRRRPTCSRNACGAFGSSLDYLERTRVALVAHGIVDPYLERLATRVAARHADAAGAHAHDAACRQLAPRWRRAGRRRR